MPVGPLPRDPPRPDPPPLFDPLAKNLLPDQMERLNTPNSPIVTAGLVTHAIYRLSRIPLLISFAIALELPFAG